MTAEYEGSTAMEFDELNRRRKVFVVKEKDILNWMRLSCGEPRSVILFLELPVATNLPTDARILAVNFDHCRQAFCVLISSKEFELVPDGAEAPHGEPLEMQWRYVPVAPNVESERAKPRDAIEDSQKAELKRGRYLPLGKPFIPAPIDPANVVVVAVDPNVKRNRYVQISPGAARAEETGRTGEDAADTPSSVKPPEPIVVAPENLERLWALLGENYDRQLVGGGVPIWEIVQQHMSAAAQTLPPEKDSEGDALMEFFKK